MPQSIEKLTDGKAVYCQLTNDNGGIIDDLIIYKLKNNEYLIIANASRVDVDFNWIIKNKADFDVEILNKSNEYSLLAIQGPKIIDFTKKIGITDLPTFFSIKSDIIFGKEVMISRTGYTGEDGIEVLCKNNDAEDLWNKFFEFGKEFGIKPIGLGARDTLRLEAALHLYGNDMDENTTPIEAGLSWSIPKDKTFNYNGKKVIEKQLSEGGSKKLVGFKMIDRAIARHEYEVFCENEKIGNVTSGSVSPTRGDNIGLAYIKNIDKLTVGSTIQIKVRDKFYNAEIINKPFVKKRNKNL